MRNNIRDSGEEMSSIEIALDKATEEELLEEDYWKCAKLCPCYRQTDDAISEKARVIRTARCELFFGIFDFVTDMLYFESALYTKISDDSAAADAMRAFLFISSFIGLLLSWGIYVELTENDLKSLKAAPEVYMVIFSRSMFEDMPQIVITLIIEHYRIEKGEIESISNVAIANIVFAIVCMLKVNVNATYLVPSDPADDDVPLWWNALFMNLFNTLPCIITACILFG